MVRVVVLGNVKECFPKVKGQGVVSFGLQTKLTQKSRRHTSTLDALPFQEDAVVSGRRDNCVMYR
jgi:hypothetical protein